MAESAEDFVVSLVDVAGATVAQRRAIGTIVNDDKPVSLDKWNRAIRIRGDSPVAHFKRAVAYLRDADRDGDALADLNRAIERVPDFAKAYFLRSVIRQRQAELAAALSDSEQAIALGYQTAASYSNRGALRSAMSTPDLEAAMSDFDRAIEIGPPRAELYNNRGVLHVQRGALELAVLDFDEAVRLCPDLLPAHANRVLARAAGGQAEEALRDMRQLSVRAAEWSDYDTAICQWVTVPGVEGEPLREFREAAVALLRSANTESTAENGANQPVENGAGEPTLATKKLTGQAFLRRLVCTPRKMTMAIISQTVDLSQQEHHVMLVAQMKKRLQDRRRQLRLEQLEPRNLLTGMISGTVFEDLNGDGVQDPGEPGMAGQTVVLERVGSSEPIATFLNPTPEPDDHFGNGSAAMGGNILIAANQDDLAGPDTGAVYLYDGTSFELIRAFPNPDPGPAGTDMFGGARIVGLGDKFITASAYKTVGAATKCGVAYLIDGSTGDTLATYHNPTPETGDLFGQNIEVIGDRVAISALKDNTAGESAGAVYVFDIASGELLRTIVNPAPGVNDNFGIPLREFNGGLMIGAKGDDTDATDAGIAYLYDIATGNCLQTFHNPTPEAGGSFGTGIAGKGNTIYIGSDQGSNEGGTVHALDGSTGTLLFTITNPTPGSGDQFGGKIAMLGEHVAVGARRDSDFGTEAGAAYLFDGASGALLQTFQNPTPLDGDIFGNLAIIGDRVLISAKLSDQGAFDAGAAYLFEPVLTTTTDAVGAFTFDGQSPDDYVVRQMTPNGFIQTAPDGDGTHLVSLGPDGDLTGLDFGNQWEPVNLFADSFENGQWDGLWAEDSQNDWFTSTQRATDGSYSAEVDGYASNATLSIADPIDLTPYGGAELTFDWYIESGFDSGEYLALDLFNGSSWVEVAMLSGNVDQENTWHSETIAVDGAYLVDDFQFRFRAKVSRYNEDANVDNVRLVATSLATPPNADPTAGDDAATTAEDNDVVIAVLLNDADSDGDPLGVASVTQGNRGTVTINGDNTVTYTPNADSNGVDSFTYTVGDGNGGTDAGSVEVTVNAVNDAPVADELYLANKENQPLAITLTAVDVENDPLTYVVVAPPADGTLTGAAPDLTFTPDVGYAGLVTFTFQANDGDLSSNLATVTIDVAANHVPQADDQSVNVNEDSSAAITLAGSDADGDPLTFEVVTGPVSGVLTGTAPDLTYTPSDNYDGSDSFTFRVNDGTDDSALATVSITVAPVNDAPVANDTSATTAEDTAASVTLTGSDIDGDALTFAIATQPSHGTLSGSGADRTYTPDADYHGSDSFTYVANDGTVESLVATVSLTITSVNDAPVADALAVAADQDTAVGITVTASDVDFDPLNFTVIAGPGNGVLSGTAPNLIYTPNGGYTGADSFTFVANDGTVNSNVATVSITVTAVATGPNLAHGVIQNVGSGWITVDLGTAYDSMVVIATPNYDNTSYPGVVRIQNAVGSSFDVRIDAAGPNTPGLMDVYYVVVEEGVYDQSGFKMEAVKFTSTVTDENNNWAGESRTYQQSYSAPVVVGQVMTSNDAWSVFWAAGSSRTAPPSSTALTVGKMVGEDTDTTRVDETIGYLVIEASGSGTDEIEGLPYVAGVGADTVRGPTNAPPYIYNYTAMPNAKTAVVSQAGMDGGNGGWAMLYGDTPVPATSGTLSLAVDEDQVADSERYHTTEQIAYFVIDPPIVTAAVTDQPRETSHARTADWPIVIMTQVGDHQLAAHVARQTSHQLPADWPWNAASSERMLVTGNATLTDVAASRVARDAAFAKWTDDEQLFELFDDEVCPLTELGQCL